MLTCKQPLIVIVAHKFCTLNRQTEARNSKYVIFDPNSQVMLFGTCAVAENALSMVMNRRHHNS